MKDLFLALFRISLSLNLAILLAHCHLHEYNNLVLDLQAHKSAADLLSQNQRKR